MPMNVYDDTLANLPDPEPQRVGPTAKPAPSYDDVAKQLRDEQEGRAQTALRVASGTSPDRAAQAARISRDYGLPADTVIRNFDEISKRITAIETQPDALFRQHPGIVGWLANPTNAAIAQDDIPSLHAISSVLSFGDSIRRGVEVAKNMGYGFLEATGEATGWTGLTAFGREGRLASAAEMNVLGQRSQFSQIRSPWEFMQWAKETIGEQIPIMAPPMAGGVVGASAGSYFGPWGTTIGGLIGAFAPSWVMGVGETQGNIKDADPNAQAPGAAFIGGTAVAALDTALPGHIGSKLVRTFGVETAEEIARQTLLRKVAPKFLTSVVKEGARDMATEGFTEALQEAIGAVAASRGTGTPMNWAQAWQSMVEAGAAGALLGGVTGGATGYAEARHLRTEIAAGEQQAAFYKALGEQVGQSKTAQRLPEAMRQVVEEATKDGPIANSYADVETWKSYWQSQGADPALVAAQVTGDPDALKTAEQTGEPLTIPTAVYAEQLAATEHNQFWSQELRLGDPTARNGREAVDARKTLDAQLKAAVSDAQQVVAEHPELATVRVQIEQQLVAAGMEKRTARLQAEVAAAGPVVMAMRAGVDPVEYFNQSRLRVQRETSPAAGATAGAEAGAGVHPPAAAPAATLFQDILAPAVTSSRGPGDTSTQTQPHTPEGGDYSIDRRVPDKEHRNGTIRLSHGPNSDSLAWALYDAKTGERVKTGTDRLTTPSENELATWDAIAKREAGTVPTPGWQDPWYTGQKSPDLQSALANSGGSLWLSRDLGYSSGFGTIFKLRVDPSARVFDTANEKEVARVVRRLFAEAKRGNLPLELQKAVDTSIEQDGVKAAKQRWADSLAPAQVFTWNNYDERRLMQWLSDEGYDGISFSDDTTFILLNPDKAIEEPYAGSAEDQHTREEFEHNRVRPDSSGSSQQGGPSFAQTRRGSITFSPDGATVTLLANADLSTFLHESGHWFLELASDLTAKLQALDAAALTDSQKQLLADHQAILDWLGSTDGQLTDEQHEQFTRGFEAYLMEGKAPSAELRSAFASFRAWLLGIYRSLRGLNVQLTDEVRGVFDRMLATDQAIAQERAASNVRAMFTTAEDAGMTPEQFAVYRQTVSDASLKARETLEAQVMSEVRREQEAHYKERRAAIEQQVAAELYAQPVYQALAAIRSGKNPDGSPLVENETPTPMRLSTAILTERYGKDGLKRFAFLHAKDGLDPDVVAEQFGFTSGDEMLNAVAAAPSLRQAIGQETNRRMVAEHGSMLLDGTLHEQAQAALANDLQEKVIDAELRALAKKQRQVAPFVKQAQREGAEALADAERERAYERRWLEAEANLRIAMAEGRKQAEIDALQAQLQQLEAERRGGAARVREGLPRVEDVRAAAVQRVAQMRVRDVDPRVFWSGMNRAATLATEAAAKGDFATAIRHQTQRLVNLALYREAVAQKEQATKIAQHARDLAKPTAQQRIAKAGGGHLDRINAILTQYDFAVVSLKKLDERNDTLQRWLAAREGQGLPAELDEEVIDRAERVNWRELTVEQLRGVYDALKTIEHWATHDGQLLRDFRKRQVQETAEQLATWTTDHATTKAREVHRDRRPSEERRRAISHFFASSRRLSDFLGMLDGEQTRGPWVDTIMLALDQAGAEKTARLVEARQAKQALFKAAFPTAADRRSLYGKGEYIEAIGKSLSRMERIMVALNWGNEGNRDRVRTAEGWTDAQVQAILDTLTASDLQYVQGVIDLIGSFRPDIEAQRKRIYGVAPKWVEATPIAAKAGTIAGGYFPLAYDDRLSAAAISALDLQAVDLAKPAALGYPTPSAGFTKSRVAHLNRPVRLDFGVIDEHIETVIHSLTHHEVLLDVSRLLAQPDLQTAIMQTVGDQGFKEIRNTIRDIAYGDLVAMDGFDRALTHLRSGATIVGLGYNATSALFQVLGFTNTVVALGPKYTARGFGRFFRGPLSMRETVHWLEENSPTMRNMALDQFRDIRDLSRQAESGKLGGWIDDALAGLSGDRVTRRTVIDLAFAGIMQVQRFVNLVTWLGAFEKAMAEGDASLKGAELEQHAFQLADRAVLESQGGGQAKDLPSVLRGSAGKKMWTTFASYTIGVLGNQAAKSYRRTDFTNPTQIAKFATDQLMLFVVPATMGYLLKEAIRGNLGASDDDDKLIAALVRENLGYAAGSVMGLRELSGVITGGYGYEGPAGSRAFSALSQAIKRAPTSARKAWEDGEVDWNLLRPVNAAGGILFHYPAGQLERSVRGAIALTEGETANPGVLLAGPPPKGAK